MQVCNICGFAEKLNNCLCNWLADAHAAGSTMKVAGGKIGLAAVTQLPIAAQPFELVID
jgi:hypothetical protein